MSSNKKLKMERLSPIPTMVPTNLFDLTHSFTPIGKRKDCYAIETTCSPEVDERPTTSRALKRVRTSSLRSRTKSSSKKTSSTPLSGIFARKSAVNQPSKEPHSTCDERIAGENMVGRGGSETLLKITEELETVGDDNEIHIGSFSSPEPKVLTDPDNLSPNIIFRSIIPSNLLNKSSLSTIITKTTVGLNRSLNNSINILQSAEDSEFDEKPVEQEVDQSIEIFESPAKIQKLVSTDKGTSFRADDSCIGSPVLLFDGKRSKYIENVEMSGPERKKRKRALDFASHHPCPTELDCPKSPILVFPILSSLTNPPSPSQPDFPHVESVNQDMAIPQDNINEEVESKDCPKSPILVFPILSSLTNPSSPSQPDFPHVESVNQDMAIPQDNINEEVEVESKDCPKSPIFFFDSTINPPSLPKPVDIPHMEKMQKDILKDAVLHSTSDVAGVEDALLDSPKSPLLLSHPHLKSSIQSPSTSNLVHLHLDTDNQNVSHRNTGEIELLDHLKSPNLFSDSLKCSTSPSKPDVDDDSSTIPTNLDNEILSGFTISSCLPVDTEKLQFTNKGILRIIELDSPSKSQTRIEIQEETSNDGFLPSQDSIRMCQDISSDESEGCADNKIDDKSCFVAPNACLYKINPQTSNYNSQPLNFDCTHREILPYESPSKTVKAFSEAINIGEFGSPDSTASDVGFEETANEVSDEVIMSSATQEDEFVDESEKIRPIKRRKKGTLLQRAGFIASRIDASQALFDYEIKAGLRPLTGKFVSSPLVICKLWPGENSTKFLLCKSLKSCESDSQLRHSNVVVIVNEVSKDITTGSVMRLHYPVTAMYCNILHSPYIIAYNQLIPAPDIPKFIQPLADHVGSSKQPRPTAKLTLSSLKVFPFCSINNLEEALLCQCLVDSFELSVRVLHVVEDSTPMVKVLCVDDEENVGWLQFSRERDILRASALHKLHILTDGASVDISGFNVAAKMVLDKKTRNLLSYCLNRNVRNDGLLIITPAESTWVVSLCSRPQDYKKVVFSINEILTKKLHGKRFLIEVAFATGDEEGNISLTDSQGGSTCLIVGEFAPKIKLDLSSPFFMDAVLNHDGKLYADEYTKLLPSKPPRLKL